MNDRFCHHIWPCFGKNAGDCNLQVCFTLCPCDWHTLYIIQGLFKPIARLMIKETSNIPRVQTGVFRMFFFSQHLLLKGPYSQEMLYWKSQGHNVRCHLREENSNVAKIVSTVSSDDFSGRLLGQNRFLSFGHQTVDLGMRKTACGKTWDLRWW